MSVDALNFVEALCMAQAQKCVLEKATKVGMKPATLARVAKGVQTNFEEALRCAKAFKSLNKCELPYDFRFTFPCFHVLMPFRHSLVPAVHVAKLSAVDEDRVLRTAKQLRRTHAGD